MVPVLIVDDETHIRLLLKQILESMGLSCTLASTSDQARKHLKREQFHLILLDIRMPGESGLDLLRVLHTESPDTAVVMCSVVDDPDMAREALDLGAYGYIIKPFESNEVLINVVNALRQRELELENRIHRQNLEKLIVERTADIRESEGRFRSLVETMMDGLAVIDEDGLLTYVNDRFCEML